MNAQLFNFDCTGFYHKKQVIPLEYVEEINKLWDQDQDISNATNIKKQITLSSIHAKAILHESVHEICKVCFKESYHLDHMVVVQQDQSSENKKLNLHGLTYGKNHSHYYISHLQQHIKTPCLTLVGQLSVGIALLPQSKKSGGFCYVPGSHKTSYNITGQELTHSLYKQYEDYKDVVVVPTIEPGDLIAFPESLLHGHTEMVGLSVRRIMYGMFFPTSIVFMKNNKDVLALRETLPDKLKKFIINDNNLNQLNRAYTTRPLIRPDSQWR